MTRAHLENKCVYTRGDEYNFFLDDPLYYSIVGLRCAIVKFDLSVTLQ